MKIQTSIYLVLLTYYNIYLLKKKTYYNIYIRNRYKIIVS